MIHEYVNFTSSTFVCLKCQIPIRYAIELVKKYEEEFEMSGILLRRQLSGSVSGFQAVPGCGLKATVAGIEEMAAAGLNSAEFRNYKNVRTSMPYK